MIKLKNLIYEQEVPQANANANPNAQPQATPTPPQQQGQPVKAEPQGGPAKTSLATDFANFKNSIKTIDQQKEATSKKYEAEFKKKLANKEVGVVASKAQHFQPSSEYTINVSDVKIGSHYDKAMGDIAYDLILMDGDKKYFLKSMDVSVKSTVPKSIQAPQEPPAPTVAQVPPEAKTAKDAAHVQ